MNAKLQDQKVTIKTYKGLPVNYNETYVPPDFTIKELRDCVPAHCFKRDTLKSFSYVFADLAGIAALGYLATFIDSHLPSLLRIPAWCLYWVAQGIVGTGIWVIGHECGHGSFSATRWVNNVTGMVLHSALLVPFFSWKITHSNHHKATNNLVRDEVFVPKHRREANVPSHVQSTPSWFDETLFEETPIYHIYQAITQTFFGWQVYLFTNVTGPKYARGSSHFDPNAPLFKPHQYYQIVMSVVGVLFTLGVLVVASYLTSASAVIKFYGVPYMFVHGWLVTITFLQHTDPAVPYYTEKEWNFVRGALCTIDRDYGWLLNTCFHHITDTHVAHHLFSQMPHYNALEATEHIKKKLGKYYNFDDTNFAVAVYENIKKCKFVDGDGDVLFYHNASKLPKGVTKQE
ncbi:hypothetical protein H4219_001537 [Mycoemilia scoparia]|uniref:Fatty acid desaturase domain-containing protein n=1 Tax=Mycoemilia scoparia TaxID=417184 RepID=A0A9W8DVA1_9FUNG|nr:hypothetical protein H4219_001537 [Mycoemilia scoparia]